MEKEIFKKEWKKPELIRLDINNDTENEAGTVTDVLGGGFSS